MGAAASTFTTTYTNQAGTGGQAATYAHPANALTVGQMFPFSYASGDYGCRSVSQVQLSADTGTAGNWGLVLLRRVLEVPIMVAGSGELLDALDCCLQSLDNDGCYAGMWFANSTSVNPIDSSFNVMES